MSKPSSGHYAGTYGANVAVAGASQVPTGKPMNVSAKKVRFSQTSVNGSQEIIESMRKNGWVGPPVDVVRMDDGGLTTLDNTRVVAAQIAGIDVRAVVHAYNDPLPNTNIVERFTTRHGRPRTWGEAVELRIRKQSSSFRTSHPKGSYKMKKVN